MKKSCKPDTSCHHTMTASDGTILECYQSKIVTGTWLKLPTTHGQNRCLSVQVVDMGGTALKYAGYRNGIDMAETLAIAVDEDDQVTVQVILPGHGDEVFRTKEIPLEDLCDLVRKHYHP